MTISVIVPVYNTEAYLSNCIESILSQSFTDFEILLVDDGSKDRSGAICDEYAAKDSRVRVFHKENGGVSSARNLALEKAKGEWVCFVDSDDCLCFGGLQELYEGISDQVDLVMAGFVEATPPVDGIEFVPGERKMVAREKVMMSMFNNPDRVFEGYTWAKLFRRDLIVKENITFNPAIFIKEDTLFVVTYLCLSDKKVSVSDAQVYYYIKRFSSAMESLEESYNPKYHSSFEAVAQINHFVESTFPHDRQLLHLSHDEVMNRVYLIVAHMRKHAVEDKRVVSKLKKRAFQEVGILAYLNYQFRRNKRRAIRIVNKTFNTSFHV